MSDSYEHAEYCMSILHDGQQAIEPCNCHIAKIDALRREVAEATTDHLRHGETCVACADLCKRLRLMEAQLAEAQKVSRPDSISKRFNLYREDPKYLKELLNLGQDHINDLESQLTAANADLRELLRLASKTEPEMNEILAAARVTNTVVISQRRELRAQAEEIEKANTDNLILRQLTWLGHGHSELYGDDGEMQCGHAPVCDFKRFPVANIQAHIDARGIAELTVNQQLTEQLQSTREVLSRQREFIVKQIDEIDHHRDCRHNIGDLCDCEYHRERRPFTEALADIDKVLETKK